MAHPKIQLFGSTEDPMRSAHLAEKLTRLQVARLIHALMQNANDRDAEIFDSKVDEVPAHRATQVSGSNVVAILSCVG